MRAEPICCYRPRPEAAPTFASLPYDVFDREQARAYVESHPGSFLAIDRPETAFAPDHDMYAADVYAKAAELIQGAAREGTILKDETPCYYIYRLEQGGRSQTGVVCACAVSDYLDGTIKRHENTRRDKERDRIEREEAAEAYREKDPEAKKLYEAAFKPEKQTTLQERIESMNEYFSYMGDHFGHV